eukprot:TRINITY_DN3121_c0_g1_i7.p1 TRINITY_DN3121_c0_g1~~TRINITY_DN3121_c0_g1_i7.p1  ORF type:complete len:297 (+),score=62.08 TRINITY_DN3121_c0_g1_i7:109-891(+)
MALGQRIGRLEPRLKTGIQSSLFARGGGERIEFYTATVRSIEEYNYNSKIFHFNLNKPLKLEVGQHVQLSSAKGRPLVRSYTPISPVGISEELSILIKLYPDGSMGKILKNVSVGNELKFKVSKNNYTCGKHVKKIGLIAGGTGIAPLYQILQSFLPENHLEFRLLFSNVVEEDILLRKELDEFTTRWTQNFKVNYVLTNPQNTWNGLTGRIDREKIVNFLPGPDRSTQICVCGPIGMTNSMDRILHDIGYTSQMIHLFL